MLVVHKAICLQKKQVVLQNLSAVLQQSKELGELILGFTSL